MEKISWRNILIGILSFIVLAVVSFGLIYAIFVLVFKGLDKNVQSTIIAAGGTIIASVIAVIYNHRRTKEREIAEAHRPQKIEVYKKFMEMYVNIIKSGKKGQILTGSGELPEDLENSFFEFTRDVIVWGSPDVIKAYSAFRSISGDKYNIIFRVDEMLREIRKDLGNSNKGIKSGDLIKLFLTDPENLDAILQDKKI